VTPANTPPAPGPRPPAPFFKRLLFRLLGKDPDAVVVSFCSGDEALAARMVEEVRGLVPDRRHFVVKPRPGSAWQIWRELRREFRGLRVGLAPVLFTPEPSPLRLAAFLLAPRKVLAYNTRLERHHLRLRHWIASTLFLRGVPVDRIFLRPRWLCPWKRDRTIASGDFRVVEGRLPVAGRPRVGVLAPYFPYPLSHGGAVRMWNLLREASREFGITLFAFTDGPVDPGPVAEFCSRIVLVDKPRYREPRWSTLLPPEVHEFRSPAMRAALERYGGECALLQTEYTHLAPYGGGILVEHDVTFDLFGQVWRRERSLPAWWAWFRWRRFERRAVRRFPHVVVMSDKDSAMLGRGTVIENGVDLERYQPQPETPGRRLLFIGSFRHFPNVAAYLFFAEQVWPALRSRFPDMSLTVVAGPDHLVYWQAFTNRIAPAADPRIRMLGFVADVRPLYVEANLVVVPTTVSAGTNVKVLEAMAMERAVVSTPSGCAGLGLEHAASVWVADSAEEFAAGIEGLIEKPQKRAQMAQQARKIAQNRFDWRALGEKQRALWRRAISG
jgi:glycosyltransferase involved in cell wall biosynthesis